LRSFAVAERRFEYAAIAALQFAGAAAAWWKTDRARRAVAAGPGVYRAMVDLRMLRYFPCRTPIPALSVRSLPRRREL
jgi:hypothetical protein